MGRKDTEHYAHFTRSWRAPSYTVDENRKVVGGYTPPGRNNWGRWGDEDQRGTANLISDAMIAGAAGLVERGRIFSLALPIDPSAPRFPSRAPAKHYFTATGADALAGTPLSEWFPPMVETEPAQPKRIGPRPQETGYVYNDDVIELATQGSTQWDGLAHVVVEDTLYNGYWAGTVTAAGGAAANGMEHVHSALVGRGVLLDAARHAGVDSLEPGTPITGADLDAICEAEGVVVGPGDILLLRTGYLQRWWGLNNDDSRAEYMRSWPGVGLTAVDWLADRDVAAAACDTTGFEVMPSEGGEILPVHDRLIVDLGFFIGELWDLELLAADCAEDGRYTFLLVAPPLYIPHAVGSPLNPIALK
jgi:kynurenine formamidase